MTTETEDRPFWQRRPKVDRNDVRDYIWDYAANHPEGFVAEEFCEEYALTYSQFAGGVRRLREFLSDDSINLVCQPNGTGQWTYRLVGDLDDMKPWTKNRLNDARSRIQSLTWTTSSLVASTDGRTADGKISRAMHRGLTRILEDIEALQE